MYKLHGLPGTVDNGYPVSLLDFLRLRNYVLVDLGDLEHT